MHLQEWVYEMVNGRVGGGGEDGGSSVWVCLSLGHVEFINSQNHSKQLHEIQSTSNNKYEVTNNVN